MGAYSSTNNSDLGNPGNTGDLGNPGNTGDLGNPGNTGDLGTPGAGLEQSNELNKVADENSELVEKVMLGMIARGTTTINYVYKGVPVTLELLVIHKIGGEWSSVYKCVTKPYEDVKFTIRH